MLLKIFSDVWLRSFWFAPYFSFLCSMKSLLTQKKMIHTSQLRKGLICGSTLCADIFFAGCVATLKGEEMMDANRRDWAHLVGQPQSRNLFSKESKIIQGEINLVQRSFFIFKQNTELLKWHWLFFFLFFIRKFKMHLNAKSFILCSGKVNYICRIIAVIIFIASPILISVEEKIEFYCKKLSRETGDQKGSKDEGEWQTYLHISDEC